MCDFWGCPNALSFQSFAKCLFTAENYGDVLLKRWIIVIDNDSVVNRINGKPIVRLLERQFACFLGRKFHMWRKDREKNGWFFPRWRVEAPPSSISFSLCLFHFLLSVHLSSAFSLKFWQILVKEGLSEKRSLGGDSNFLFLDRYYKICWLFLLYAGWL